MVAWMTAFRNESERKAGRSQIIYTTADWWNTCTSGSAAFSAYQLWIAAYGTSPIMPAAWPAWTLWQYTSQGTVPGISGRVDLSYFSNSAGTLANPAGQTAAVGAPAWLRVHALAGSAPVSAAGLPPGVSLNASTGLISGWPTTAGTYPAAVSAATAPFPAPATSVSFTSTLTPAPNSGPPAPLLLRNGGKCMDDPAYQTANGTRIATWSCGATTAGRCATAQRHTLRL